MRSAVRFPVALTVGLALLASRLFSFETENHNAVAYRISQPVVIDGELDESAWREASPVSSFTQREPREGEPASEWTQVKVLFDDHSLYIGFICHDREPSKFVANEMRRDAVLEDDDFFEKSSFGVIALSQDPFVENGKDYNHGAGLDFSLAFGQNFQAGGFVAKTFTPSSRGKDWAGYLSLIWSSDFFSSDISYTDIGKNFNAEMGFVPRLDMKRLRLNVGIGPRPKILNIRQMLLFNHLIMLRTTPACSRRGLISRECATLSRMEANSSSPSFKIMNSCLSPLKSKRRYSFLQESITSMSLWFHMNRTRARMFLGR